MATALTTKERVCRLVDDLQEEDLLVAERMLRGLLLRREDPLIIFLESCPVDDEEETPEERERVSRVWEAIDRGEVVPHEEVMRRARERRREHPE